MQAARHGMRRIRDGELVAVDSAAEVRAPLLRAARLHEARLLAWDGIGDEPEESVEAEAGAILEAEAAIDLHEVRGMIGDYLKALGESNG